jgi:Putative DnaT-like ssDNA binding protein
MSYIVEDGTLVDNANAYISTAYADTYHSDRGNTAWAGYTDAQKQSAIIKSTAFLDAHFTFYGTKYVPDPTNIPNNLGWPKFGAYDRFGLSIAVTTIPQQLQEAVAELAYKVAGGTTLLEDVERQTKSEKVGPISIVYDDTASPSTRYKYVEELLTGLITSSKNYFDVARA